MKLKWFGTASVALTGPSGSILFDPFVPLKGSDVDTKLEDFDGFGHIFVTHGHFDHIVSIPAVVERNPGASVYCTKTPFETLLKKGVPEKNLRLISFGQTLEAAGFEVSVRHGKHTPLPGISPGLILHYLRYPGRRNAPFLLRENRICRENDETVFYHVSCGGKNVSLMGSLNIRDDVDYPCRADALVLPFNGVGDLCSLSDRIISRLSPGRILLDHYDNTFPPLTQPVDAGPLLRTHSGKAELLEHKKEYEI
ncbi:MAG: MBL fold metallo-hydrolase [Clostridia bacterium]|nr:MBL fold metallo-hydrolase [Clostridia bacterium]